MNLERLTQFLIELDFSNTKTWFDAHRSEYQALKLEFIDLVQHLIDGIAVFDKSVSGVSAKNTLFRINRDTRYSHNKNPYKTHFSAAIAAGGRHSRLPIYYLQLGIENSVLAGGIYLPESEDLTALRRFISQHPKKADGLLKNKHLLETFGGLDTEHVLSRFPKGFEAGSALLKHKSFTVSHNFDPLETTDLLGFVLEYFCAMQPLHQWLRDALVFAA
jgi:uncharacterized protein (TIGR02453 family)